MIKSKIVLSSALVATGVLLAVPRQPARAQTRPVLRGVTPEKQLLGVKLGRPFMEVIRRFGNPDEIQTVALAAPTDTLPGLGGQGGVSGDMAPGMGGGNGPGGAMGAFGAPGMAGGSPFGGGGNGPGAFGPPGLAGGSPFGGGGNGPGFGGGGGIPVLPPAGGGNGPGGGGFPGAFGGAGDMGGMGMGSTQQLPEYSSAILWIYRRTDSRLEFLINEDGRVAQISVASPANAPYRGAFTSKGVQLGSSFATVMERYGQPERWRALPGLRFYEAYYTKNYHTAFTFDTKKSMKVVRVTIALAD